MIFLELIFPPESNSKSFGLNNKVTWKTMRSRLLNHQLLYLDSREG